LVLLIAGLLGLGACTSLPVAPGAFHVGGAGQSSESGVHRAMALLQRGEERRAKAQLEAVLDREPGNVTAQRLLREIQADPRELLGARAHDYVVREGDTMSGLAQDNLGDPLLFYALARYNDMAPAELRAGQTIQIPDRGRWAANARRQPNSPTPPGSPAAMQAPEQLGAAATSAGAQRANQLRLQGLQRLNTGDADGAVALLRQALALDSENPAIQRDLSRAQRIQASLRAP
jgi:hypothetical protein